MRNDSRNRTTRRWLVRGRTATVCLWFSKHCSCKTWHVLREVSEGYLDDVNRESVVHTWSDKIEAAA